MMPGTPHHFFLGTLRGRLMVSVAAVHALMMALFVADLTVRQRALLLERQEEQARALSNALATSGAGWIAARDLAGLQELADVQRNYPELLFAILTDEQGSVLAHTDHSQRGRFLLDLPTTPRQTILFRSVALMDVATPAQLGGRQVGWAQVGVGQKAAATKLAQITKSGALYAVAAILVGSAIAGWLGRRMTRRLYIVQESMNRVRQGDREVRVALPGNDEAARLAAEFDAMLAVLAEREAALRVSEENYRGLIQRIHAAVVVHGADTQIQASNPRAQELLGLTEAQMLGKLAADPGWHFCREDGTPLPLSEYPVNRVLASGEPLRDATLGVHLPGRGDDAWVLVNADPVHDTQGKIGQVIVTFVDISGRRRAEQALRKLNEQLEQRVKERTTDLQAKGDELKESQQALINIVEDLNEKTGVLEATNNKLEVVNRELEAFTYSVSHDLRAPLRAIDGFSQALLEDYSAAMDERAQHYLHRVRRAAQRMARLIDDMLSLARVTRGELRMERVKLSRLAQEIAEGLVQGEPQRTVRFCIAPDVQVTGDARFLRVALENLLGNAWKFTSKRSEALIEFGLLDQRGERVCFVRDNGAGFDMKYAGRLFGAFQRLHTSEEFPGTGIGLATVQRIIHRHGGRVWANAQVDQGATLFFTLPGHEGDSHRYREPLK